MLPHRLPRPFVRISSYVCVSCRSAYPSNVFHRAYAVLRKAPSTKNALRRDRPRVISDKERNAMSMPPFTLLEGLKNASLIKAAPQVAQGILHRIRESDSRFTGKKMQELCDDCGIDVMDMFWVARACLYSRNGLEAKRLGKVILLTMSGLKIPQATFHLLRMADRQESGGWYGAFNSLELAVARSHLQELVAKRHPEAMHLQALRLEKEGKRKEAIVLLREAISCGAANTSSETEEEKARKKYTATYLGDTGVVATTSPYTTLACWETAQGGSIEAIDRAEAAFRAGANDHDDPEAYFYLAGWEKDSNGRYTAGWLHNMTKAAASGHYLAMERLGDFYAAPLDSIADDALRSEMQDLEKSGRHVEWLYYYLNENELKQKSLPPGTKIVSGMFWESFGEDDLGERVETVRLNARQAMAVEWYDVAWMAKIFWTPTWEMMEKESHRQPNISMQAVIDEAAQSRW